ncbi:MAG: hypothetical protein VYA84_17895 [Planctomycetota bacterium]|nr:hypothetical protein [Planctomycetota bacterium]
MFDRYSFSIWLFDAWSDLSRYFGTMDETHYGVLAGCAVLFGFLCLKGSGINR